MLEDQGLSERTGFWFLKFAFTCSAHPDETAELVLTNFKDKSGGWTFEITRCPALKIDDRDTRLSMSIAEAFINTDELHRLRAVTEASSTFERHLATYVAPLVVKKIRTTAPVACNPRLPRVKLFLSHPGSAKPLMRTLREGLEFVGYDVWYDETSFEPGDALWGTLDAAIRDCDAVVAWIDPDFLASSWCTRELACAGRYSKHVVPFGVFDEIEPGLTGELAFVKDIAVHSPREKSIFRVLTVAVASLTAAGL